MVHETFTLLTSVSAASEAKVLARTQLGDLKIRERVNRDLSHHDNDETFIPRLAVVVLKTVPSILFMYFILQFVGLKEVHPRYFAGTLPFRSIFSLRVT